MNVEYNQLATPSYCLHSCFQQDSTLADTKKQVIQVAWHNITYISTDKHPHHDSSSRSDVLWTTVLSSLSTANNREHQDECI